MAVDEDILAEHAEEAATLWALRTVFARRPQVRLGDLADHDERIEAHLDGLRLAGVAGWRIAQRVAAQAPGPGTCFVLAALACEDQDAEVRRTTLAEQVLADPAVVSGLAAGFAWRPTPRAAAASAAWWRVDVPALREAALAIDVACVNDPKALLGNACGDADVGLRARALRAVGELGRVDQVERCRRALDDRDPGCRNAALWSLALLGQEVGGALRAVATRPADAWHDRLVDLAARRLPRATVMDWLKTDAKKPELLRRAVHLAGAHGDPLVMPWLLMQLAVPAVARAAGDAFATITGVDLVEAGLTTDAPVGLRSAPTDDDVADPDEALPWPDAAKVTAWWQQHGEGIPAGVRHLLGRPLIPDHLDAVLRSGTQPQRRAAAIERALLTPGQPLVDVFAPAERQLAAFAMVSAEPSTVASTDQVPDPA